MLGFKIRMTQTQGNSKEILQTMAVHMPKQRLFKKNGKEERRWSRLFQEEKEVESIDLDISCLLYPKDDIDVSYTHQLLTTCAVASMAI